jgi:hypothetical protein
VAPAREADEPNRRIWLIGLRRILVRIVNPTLNLPRIIRPVQQRLPLAAAGKDWPGDRSY